MGYTNYGRRVPMMHRYNTIYYHLRLGNIKLDLSVSPLPPNLLNRKLPV